MGISRIAIGEISSPKLGESPGIGEDFELRGWKVWELMDWWNLVGFQTQKWALTLFTLHLLLEGT